MSDSQDKWLNEDIVLYNKLYYKPIDYYELFFSHEFIEIIAHKSNMQMSYLSDIDENFMKKNNTLFWTNNAKWPGAKSLEDIVLR